MEGNYGVYLANRLCGKVQVQRQGLYYRFVCRCSLSGNVVCRLKICFFDREQNIGVLIPMDDGFGLTTKIPVKRFSGKPVRFCVAPEQIREALTFVPIYPEEPFAYLERLKNAFLDVKNGQPGAMISE